MRKSLAIGTLFVAFAVLFAQFQSATAAIKTGDQIQLTNGVGHGPGGEFGVVYIGGTGGGLESFQDTVFCVEKNEFISFGKTYYVTLEKNALQGGGKSHGSLGDIVVPYDPSTYNDTLYGDPIGGDGKGSETTNWGDATQWLFQYFALGQLNGIGGYAANNAGSADALQNVFWYLQEEITDLHDGLGTQGERDIADGLLDWALGLGDYTGDDPNSDDVYTVVAMNLWGTYRNGKYEDRAQSQLQLVKLDIVHGPPVPEPASIGVWTALLAIGGVALRRRTKLRKALSSR